jgi:K+-sensing histidine kinase KdpD
LQIDTSKKSVTNRARTSKARVYVWLNAFIGILVCSISASLLILVTRGTAYRPMIPLFFIAVIVVVALRFGMLASSLGALVATMLFAYFLFTPVGSFRVQKGEARTNLVWMLLVGVPIGYFAWSTRADLHDHSDGA